MIYWIAGIVAIVCLGVCIFTGIRRNL